MDVMVRSYKSLEEEEEAILSAFRVFDKVGIHIAQQILGSSNSSL